MFHTTLNRKYVMQNLNYADFNIGYVQTHLISLISPMGHQIQ